MPRRRRVSGISGVSAALLAAATMLAAAGSSLAQAPPAAPGGNAPPSNDTAPPSNGDASPSDDSAPPSNEAASPSNEDTADKPYTVKCGPDPEEGGNVCYVDRATYVGWRTFHAVCHTCHAQDAVGSTFAPNLLERMRVIDKATFLMVVDQGFEGQVGVMPAWGNNPNVNKYYEELWSYLRARSDGVLLPGRPKRLPESK